MKPLSFKRHRFPPVIIRHAIWLYARFTLSFRDVEELLAERGVDVSYESVRRWFLKFGPAIAANIRRTRPQPSDHWHLDEMVITIGGNGIVAGSTSRSRPHAAVAPQELALADEIAKRDGTGHLFTVGVYLTCAIQ